LQYNKIIIQILDSVYRLIYAALAHIAPRGQMSTSLDMSPDTLSRFCTINNIHLGLKTAHGKRNCTNM